MKIGITGHTGFIGYHLKNTLLYQTLKSDITLIDKDHFISIEKLKKTLNNIDVLFHLAGINRHDDENFIYDENVRLAKVLIEAIEAINFDGKVVLASTTMVSYNTNYGKSKLRCTEIFDESSKKNGYKFTSLIIPNVFGQFCRPNYNSFIATFCFNIINNIPVKVNTNKAVSLIYIDNLVKEFISEINNDNKTTSRRIAADIEISPKKVYDLLTSFEDVYIKNNLIPKFKSKFEESLFYTFISYVDLKQYFPISHQKHTDKRGYFSEVIKLGGESQFSYSITKKGITRGNHFHTRKIERFTVIKGKAQLNIRKIGTNNIIHFKIEKTPQSVDMFPWFTHNIENIGDEDLITLFSVNEHFNENDPDTYSEKV